MTVSTQINKVQYNGPGSGPFTITYPFLKDTDILVVKTDSSGTDTTLILNTDFTVSGAGNPSGGELNLTTPLSASDRITIVREVELVQEVDYLPNDKFPAETHEEALDRLTMITQQLDEKITRAVVLPISALTGDLELPGIVPYGIWRWDQIGNAIEFVSAAEAFAGSPPLDITLGGTGADNAVDARTNLGLTIGSNVQAYSPTLNSIAPLGTAADRLLYTTALNTWAESPLTPFARTLLDDSDATTARSTLGLGTLATQDGTFSGTSSGTNTGDQNLFSTIAVSGQNSIVAGSTTDTLNLVAGTNVTITTDENTNEVTITASGGSGDVSGPATSTSGAIAVWDDTSGNLLKDSNILVGSGSLSGLGEINSSTSLDINTNVVLTDGNDPDEGASISLSESTNSGSNLITLKAPPVIGTSATYILPSASADGVLTNTSGILSWEPSGGGGGGSSQWEEVSIQVLNNDTYLDFLFNDREHITSYRRYILVVSTGSITVNRLRVYNSNTSAWYADARYEGRTVYTNTTAGPTASWTVTGSYSNATAAQGAFITDRNSYRYIRPTQELLLTDLYPSSRNGAYFNQGGVNLGADYITGFRFYHDSNNLTGTYKLLGEKLHV